MDVRNPVFKINIFKIINIQILRLIWNKINQISIILVQTSLRAQNLWLSKWTFWEGACPMSSRQCKSRIFIWISNQCLTPMYKLIKKIQIKMETFLIIWACSIINSGSATWVCRVSTTCRSCKPRSPTCWGRRIQTRVNYNTLCRTRYKATLFIQALLKTLIWTLIPMAGLNFYLPKMKTAVKMNIHQGITPDPREIWIKPKYSLRHKFLHLKRPNTTNDITVITMNKRM